MAITTFHVKSKLNLELFSNKVFGVLEIHEVQQRESSHYPQDTYYKGQKDNVIIRVSKEDTEDFEDWDYWVVVEMPSPNNNYITEIMNQLTNAGLEIYKEE